MISLNNNPSIDPADNYSLVGSIQFAFQKLMQSINGMLPAQVLSYDRITNRAEIQILITIVTTNGDQIPRPTVASMPVLLLGGGGFLISFPIKPGDLGWISANDRDISLFLQSYSQSPPNTARVKNFSDGLFIPDVMKGYDISGDDDNNIVIQNLDGSNKISIGENEINIKSSGIINIESATTINVIATTRTNLTCPLVVMNPVAPGLFAVNGNITASGTITPATPIPP